MSGLFTSRFTISFLAITSTGLALACAAESTEEPETMNPQAFEEQSPPIVETAPSNGPPADAPPAPPVTLPADPIFIELPPETEPDGLLLSEDFELAALGDVPATSMLWSTTLPTDYDSGGIVEVVNNVTAHSGTQAVYVKKGNNGQGFLQLEGAPVFPFSGDKLYVRAYLMVPEWPQNHVSWMELGAAENEKSEVRIGAHQGVMQVNHWPGDEDQIADSVVFQANEWTCVEYSYELSTKSLQVWLEDELIESLTVEGGVFARPGTEVAAVPLEAVRFGAEIAATEIWFDDIQIGTSPIGCQ